MNTSISKLISYGIINGLIAKEDSTYVVNRILNLIGESSYEPVNVEPDGDVES